MDRLLSFKATSPGRRSRVLRTLAWKEQQKVGPTVLLRIVIKRLLLPLALAMFNNYNGRRAEGGIGRMKGGGKGGGWQSDKAKGERKSA